MDQLRGLKNSSTFNPNGPPPPESVDPDYGRHVPLGTTRSTGTSRASRASRDRTRASSGNTVDATSAKRPSSLCDWDTVLIIVLAVVLFSFLILDIYAQIVRTLCFATSDALTQLNLAENAQCKARSPRPRIRTRLIKWPLKISVLCYCSIAARCIPM